MGWIYEVGKTKTHVVIHGEGLEKVIDEQGRETIKIKEGVTPLFINIGGADFYRYRPFDMELVRNGHTVVGWDPPGQTGFSENLKDQVGNPRRHTMENYAGFQNDLYSSLTDGKVNIIAMSMGGIPTEIFAGTYPDKINKLVLADTFATMKDRDFVQKVRQIWASKLNRKQAIEESLNTIFNSLKLSPQELSEAKNRFLQPQWVGDHLTSVIESFVDIIFTADATEACRKITAPTLLIAGKKDELAPVAEMEKLRALIPNAKLITVDTLHTEVLGNAAVFNSTSMEAILNHLRN